MFRNILALALLTTAFAVPATAGPAAAFNAGTLVAHAFSGCVSGANCDILRFSTPPGHAHAVTHMVTSTHSSLMPPAFNFGLRLMSAGITFPVPGCPDIFTPGAGGMTQSCAVLPQPPGVYLVGFVEFLRPHQVGTVNFMHVMWAV